MQIKDILTLVITIASFLLTVLIPTFCVMINRIKAARNAKTEAEKQAAINDLKQLAKGFIVEAENAWKATNNILKQNGGSCGANKKSEVMTKLHQACFDKKIDFDEEFWSKEVDDLVEVTRQVNAK